MSDWPEVLTRLQRVSLHTWGLNSQVGDTIMMQKQTLTAAAWPTAKRAIFMPVVVESPMTAYQIAVYNGAVAGTVDVGLYSYPATGTEATRLVSSGATTMAGETQVQAFDITDTPLTPAVYFVGVLASSASATFIRSNLATLACQASGVQQQGSLEALPSTATLANPSGGYVPLATVSGVATI